MREEMLRTFEELRFEPTDKRVRAEIGAATALDSRRAVLVWEPRHVVPNYAVPREDVQAELIPADPARPSPPGLIHPGMPFRDSHGSEGEPLSLRLGGDVREGAGFLLTDAELQGHVLVDFKALDAWYEEDEPIVGHARDPFHRVDIRRSTRHVRVELDGTLLAESSRPSLLFETNLPTRFYLPREDVRAEMRPSEKRTYCAYKGQASYWSFDASGGENLAWTYERPLPEAGAITGLVAFFNERADMVVDGERLERPRTQWSEGILDEAGVGR